MRRLRRAALGALAATLGSCSLPTAPEPIASPANRCSAELECTTSVCCYDGALQSSDVRYSRLLLEIIVPGTGSEAAGPRIYQWVDVSNLPNAPLVLELPRRRVAQGRLRAFERESMNCYEGAQSTVPVRITLTPREQLLGLAVVPYVSTSRLDRNSEEHLFQVEAPPGRYDVHVESLATDCDVAPQILHDFELVDSLELEESEPEPLNVHVNATVDPITGIGDWNLENWTLDIIHPVTGGEAGRRGCGPPRVSATDSTRRGGRSGDSPPPGRIGPIH